MKAGRKRLHSRCRDDQRGSRGIDETRRRCAMYSQPKDPLVETQGGERVAESEGGGDGRENGDVTIQVSEMHERLNVCKKWRLGVREKRRLRVCA
eukprot:6205979-Pleurochrysis_carterae.AAC.1